MSPFSTLARKYAQDNAANLRFSRGAMHLLQSSIETHLVRLANDANMEAIHGGRTEVSRADIQLARRIIGGRT